MEKLDVDLTQEMLELLDEMVNNNRAVDRADALCSILREIIRAREEGVAGDSGGIVIIRLHGLASPCLDPT